METFLLILGGLVIAIAIGAFFVAQSVTLSVQQRKWNWRLLTWGCPILIALIIILALIFDV